MTTLVFEKTGVKVEYKVDLGTRNDGNFTVMSIEGLDTADIEAGMDLKQLSYDMGSFKEFADTHNLKLTLVNESGSTVVVDYTEDSSSS